MATFLDVTGLEQFGSLFVFIFVFLAVWAILNYFKFLGVNQVVNVLIALILAIFVLVSELATNIIYVTAPWIVIVFIFMIFFSMIMKSFGAGDSSEFSGLKALSIAGIIIAIIIGAATYARDAAPVDGEESDEVIDYGKATNIIFHPMVLGMLMIFAIAAVTVALMVKR